MIKDAIHSRQNDVFTLFYHVQLHMHTSHTMLQAEARALCNARARGFTTLAPSIDMPLEFYTKKGPLPLGLMTKGEDATRPNHDRQWHDKYDSAIATKGGRHYYNFTTTMNGC